MGEKVLVEAWGVSGDWEEPGGVLEESWGGVLGASLGVLASFGRSWWGSWREDLGGGVMSWVYDVRLETCTRFH